MMKRFILMAFIATTIIGCKKEDIAPYESDPGISFYVGQNAADSLTYSFAYSSLTPGSLEKTTDTVFLNMRLTGEAAPVDRKIRIIAKEGTTARPDVDFKLPEIVLPADSIFVRYPLVVFNTPEMKTQVFRVVLEVAPSDDLSPGSVGIDRDSEKSLNQFKVLVTNRLEKPTWWSASEDYAYGPYSEVRYRFMMQNTGIIDFSQGAVGISGLWNIPVKLRIALAKYEEDNGPLMDGNTRITF